MVEKEQSGRRSYVDVQTIKPGSPTETGKYSIYMYTNRAKSAEVVRIASNQPGNEAVLAAMPVIWVYMPVIHTEALRLSWPITIRSVSGHV